ncbi:IclR family transcriptional regulator [Streptomyces europaeiscabiei]|uniref:IclR family transcriptional regulator n=1 Tax=Streptomyces TaxID=1883 RepID=UPI000A38D25E|nr:MULTISPECIES: IclR family transcriptional regulator [Streptomyces]MDX3586218.1 IclR family transcriptional regulator [Streptomyces europaeiscabiei]MDX3612798.1 IclR family transcriptional regulator [Streptomyces europaeiscabiei]MDX3636209.1 IclR family transcriptional regulator [Streptomyces europaeiscabiei]MDX3654213.1 IclR family transcriptional regulator [Streptomyces europaeiscabiei]WUD30171.1 IclR family transcriptional regulator [Streptomyces europaeiscabiei]
MTETDPRENGERQGIQSVETAMRVLLALENGGGALSLSAIAQASGMQPSKVHRYLVSLGRIGLTSQDPASGLYDFGAAMRRMGAEALRRTNEVAVAGGHAMQLRDRTGHSVNLAVWGDRGPLVVSWAYGTRPLPLTVRVGATLPLLTSSVGQVFLALLPESLTGEVLSGELRGKEAEWTSERLAAIRAQVREEGHAVTHSGVIPGIISVAAPVFAANDPLPLAVSVVLPESLGTPDHLAEVTRELRDTVSAASQELGYLS